MAKVSLNLAHDRSRCLAPFAAIPQRPASTVSAVVSADGSPNTLTHLNCVGVSAASYGVRT